MVESCDLFIHLEIFEARLVILLSSREMTEERARFKSFRPWDILRALAINFRKEGPEEKSVTANCAMQHQLF